MFKSKQTKVKSESIKYMVNTIKLSRQSSKNISNYIDDESVSFLLDYSSKSDARIQALRPLFAAIIAVHSYPNQEDSLINGLKTDLKYITEVQFSEALARGELSSEFFQMMTCFNAETTAFMSGRNLI